MSNISKLEFTALNITGENYLSWVLDVELHLAAMSLEDTIVEGNTRSQQDRAKALIFLRHHLHEGLKTEYLTIKDPQILWQNLKERYDHLIEIFLPRAQFEWSNLRFQDFKNVGDYNSKLLNITSILKLCKQPVTDKEMIDKTLSTFHPANIVQQEQYRERRVQKYSELNSILLRAEQDRQLLMKNAEMRPPGSMPVPEAHATTFRGGNKWNGRRGGRWPRNGQYKRGGKYRGNSKQRGPRSGPYNQQLDDGENKQDKGKNPRKTNFPKNAEETCYRCGMEGHWSRTCRTAKHLVDLYQASKKGPETNFVNHESVGTSHLDVSDFLVEPDYNVNLMDDENIFN